MLEAHIISWNYRGLNNRVVRGMICDFARKTRAYFLCLQETKCSVWEKPYENTIWDKGNFGWVVQDSDGLS